MSGEDASAATFAARDVARSFGAASRRYDDAAVLQALVRDELLSRLALLRETPRVVLDLGAGTGLGAAALKRAYPRAEVTAVDLSPAMLEQARRHSRLWRRIRCVAADARALPMETASVDLVFTSLMLQWVDPLDAALAQIRRVLRPGGLMLASSFGPLTLQELRAAWARADEGVHVNAFVDMHDFGSALQRAGFSEPVLDVDRHVRHYADAATLMREIKAIGAHNVHADRRRGLTGRRAFGQMNAAYEAQRGSLGLPATWEVVYAVAWAPEQAPRHAAPSGEFHIGVDQLRGSLKARR
jgi:malonyl-CoA O-methyltransferase